MDQESPPIFSKPTSMYLSVGAVTTSSNARAGGILNELKAKGYAVADSTDDLNKYTNGKLAALVAYDFLPKVSEGRGDFLRRATHVALQLLKTNPKGFFLMVEGSQIDLWGTI